MKTFYFSTLLLIALIGAGIYFSATYQAPTPAPMVAATSTISMTTAVPPPLKLPSSDPVPVTATRTPPPSAAPTPAAQAPGAPQDLAVDVSSPTQADLSWTPPAGSSSVLGYAVYRNFSEIGLTPDAIFSDTGYSSQYTYSYSVTAYDKNGLQSAYSQVVTIAGDLGTPPASTSTAVAVAPPPTPAPTPSPTPTPSPSPKPAPSPSPSPAPSASSCGSGGACTAAQIATHNTRGDCWVYLSQINKAYNITAYVQNPSQHPGGDVIASHCGTDIYSYFLGTAGGHTHSSYALNTVLQAYYIGPMQ
ncbi:MAG: cytochrome b5-like heme/steroid binding domain-containing protein [Candidatus Pacebacteria bacterium]|nr:cytochrome b5-like heme/steroid binding domain-containing protein [Candidatus Paceibacterota bacterium]